DACARRVDPPQAGHPIGELLERERPLVGAVDSDLDLVEVGLALLAAQGEQPDPPAGGGLDLRAELVRERARECDGLHSSDPSPTEREPTRTVDSAARRDSSSSGM